VTLLSGNYADCFKTISDNRLSDMALTGLFSDFQNIDVFEEIRENMKREELRQFNSSFFFRKGEKNERREILKVKMEIRKIVQLKWIRRNFFVRYVTVFLGLLRR
jgi:hypothetical protein